MFTLLPCYLSHANTYILTWKRPRGAGGNSKVADAVVVGSESTQDTIFSASVDLCRAAQMQHSQGVATLVPTKSDAPVS